ncbi:ESPR-type extended signal peptide-containing protein, partial [Mannheimia sp. HC-2023]|uniref:collagen-flanked surface repeat-containing protein n=1 Tax=Mannheimia indoligenes TaxID=3103145 RepID=UPI002FE5E1D6
MNKIYKVLWNYATQTWVVTSEIGKAHKKTKSQVDKVKSPSLIALAAVGGVLLGSQAMAATAISFTPAPFNRGTVTFTHNSNDGEAKNTYAVASRTGSIAIGDANSTANTGNITCATMASSIAIGMGAKAVATKPTGDESGKALENYSQAVAIGRLAQATGDQSVALGADTKAQGHSSIAIGGDDLDAVAGVTYGGGGTAWSGTPYTGVNTSRIATQYKQLTGEDLVNLTSSDVGRNPTEDSRNRQYTGTSSGQAAIAIGVSAVAKDLSTSFGTRTYAANIATALGVGANASKVNSVALGAGSTTKTDATKEDTATVNGVTYNGFKGDENVEAGDQVSVGGATFERQIKHVAPGKIDANSTDAINGSQLYQIVQQGAWEVQTGSKKLSDVNWGDKVNFTSSDNSVEITGTPENGQKVTTIDLKVKPAAGGNGSFVLQENGSKKDDIQNNDVVNFKNGGNTKVVVTNTGSTKNDVQINVTGLPVQYTAPDGTPVVKVGDKYYKVDANGNPTDQEVPKDQLVINATNPTAAPNQKGNPVAINNVTSNLKNDAPQSLLNLTNPNVKDDTVATVGDLRNMGWIVSASNNNYTNTVKNANEVKFIGENGVTVTGATAGDVRNITVKGTKVESKTNNDGSYTITITNPDNTTSTMTVRNGLNGKDGAAGAKGEKGDPGVAGAKGDKGDAGAKGEKGDTGAQGPAGKDGQSPTATITTNPNGTHTITVKNPDGSSSTATVKDGAKGDKGDAGAKGDKGDAGAQGPAGKDGTNGVDGKNATATVTDNKDGTHTITVTNPDNTTTTTILRDGKNGTNGVDGKNATATVTDNKDGTHTITVTNPDNTTTTTILRDGEKGKDGTNGVDGKNATATVTDNKNGTHTITVTNPDGSTTTTTVKDGAKGDKGDNGKDGQSATAEVKDNGDGSH